MLSTDSAKRELAMLDILKKIEILQGKITYLNSKLKGADIFLQNVHSELSKLRKNIKNRNTTLN